MVYKYQPYYQYKPTRENFMVGELSQEEVERNKELLIDDLTNHFSEIGGLVETVADGVISITTELSQDQCDDIVKSYLSSLYLFAHKP